ncbi:MAG: ATP-binding protein [Comamonadaceae bacterium]|nr:ATP-binding protein [Comamonadaceae bacterium]
MESLLARIAHRGDLRAAQAGELLLAHRARPDPRGRLRDDPRRSRHRQERRPAPAGRASGRAWPTSPSASINHPQSNLADFYRELGDIFAVPLRPHNRWGGFKALRERWLAHLETTRRRAVLLIDEAQEMSPAALCELRLLASARFDSQPLLCVVLAGDARLIEKLRREELIPLGQPHPHPAGHRARQPRRTRSPA